MTALRHMIIANFKMTLRNRMAIFWNLAFPAVFIIFFGLLLTMDLNRISVGISGEDVSPLASELVAELRSNDVFDVKTGDAASELDALAEGERGVVILFSQGANGQLNAEIHYDQSDPQMGEVSMRTIQHFLNEANLAVIGDDAPIATTVQAVDSNAMRYIDFLVPGILAMSIMNTGVIGLSTAFVTYREKGILRRIKATPFPLSSFIAARIISQVVIIVAQAMILMLLGMLLFDLRVDGQLINVVLMVTIGAIAFLSLGFVISSFARNAEAAASLSNAVTFPMLFLSGVFFSVDDAPTWLQPFTRIMPLRYLADGLRDLMVRGGSLPDQWLNILVLLGTAAVAVFLSMRLFKWEANPA
jgi:ABC-2 type transport system permease protein